MASLYETLGEWLLCTRSTDTQHTPRCEVHVTFLKNQFIVLRSFEICMFIFILSKTFILRQFEKILKPKVTRVAKPQKLWISS